MHDADGTILNRNVVVTGAGGFIGTAVVRLLLDHGARVNALLGVPGQAVHSVPGCVRTTVADICNTDVLLELTRGAETAIHMAGPASVSCSFEDPAEYARTHVAGTANLLHVCRITGIKRFVYISSAEVYGRTAAARADEDLPCAPRSPYGAAKASAEQMVLAFARSFGINVVILRPFSVYGPGMSPNSLIGTILRAARSEPYVRLNDLTPVRDYCYVADLACAVVRACVVDRDPAVINIGTGQGTSVSELASLVVRILGREISVIQARGNKRPGDSEIYGLVADTRRAREVLGWQASTSLEEGLRRTIASMK